MREKCVRNGVEVAATSAWLAPLVSLSRTRDRTTGTGTLYSLSTAVPSVPGTAYLKPGGWAAGRPDGRAMPDAGANFSNGNNQTSTAKHEAEQGHGAA